ncbi:MAG: hypothetical protein MMC23_008543 [Stictis urceolatum]|nr:hypothetical protein [Stictis urceolata]
MGYSQWLELKIHNATNKTLIIRDLYLHMGKLYVYPNKSSPCKESSFNNQDILPGQTISFATCGKENGWSGAEGEFGIETKPEYQSHINGNGVNGHTNGYTNGYTNGINGVNGINGHQVNGIDGIDGVNSVNGQYQTNGTNGVNRVNGIRNGVNGIHMDEGKGLRVCRLYWDCPFSGVNKLVGYYVKEGWFVNTPPVDPSGSLGNQTITIFTTTN